MRWLRTSRLWRNIFQKWTVRAREQLALRRESAAVVAMEERRKRYQADAQQRLAWVDEGLAQRIVEDSTCPVCCADAGGLPIPGLLCFTMMNAYLMLTVQQTVRFQWCRQPVEIIFLICLHQLYVFRTVWYRLPYLLYYKSHCGPNF